MEEVAEQCFAVHIDEIRVPMVYEEILEDLRPAVNLNSSLSRRVLP